MDYLLDIVRRPFMQLGIGQQLIVVVVVVLCLYLLFYSVSHVRQRASSRRRDSRLRPTVPLKVQITWEDSVGFRQKAVGRCLDVSAGGLKMELQDPLPLQTPISFKILDRQLYGKGSVCHCSEVDSKYVLGVEFSSVENM